MRVAPGRLLFVHSLLNTDLSVGMEDWVLMLGYDEQPRDPRRSLLNIHSGYAWWPNSEVMHKQSSWYRGDFGYRYQCAVDVLV